LVSTKTRLFTNYTLRVIPVFSNGYRAGVEKLDTWYPVFARWQ
jgi:hypothetical protein